MQLLDQYFEIQKAIHDYFGYEENWKVIPLDDARMYYWSVFQNKDCDGWVRFAETKEKLEDTDSGDYYEHSIYTQRFLEKWVYRTNDFTMICVDTQTDGNKFLQVFDNTKELKLPEGYFKN